MSRGGSHQEPIELSDSEEDDSDEQSQSQSEEEEEEEPFDGEDDESHEDAEAGSDDGEDEQDAADAEPADAYRALNKSNGSQHEGLDESVEDNGQQYDDDNEQAEEFAENEDDDDDESYEDNEDEQSADENPAAAPAAASLFTFKSQSGTPSPFATTVAASPFGSAGAAVPMSVFGTHSGTVAPASLFGSHLSQPGAAQSQSSVFGSSAAKPAFAFGTLAAPSTDSGFTFASTASSTAGIAPAVAFGSSSTASADSTSTFSFRSTPAPSTAPEFTFGSTQSPMPSSSVPSTASSSIFSSVSTSTASLFGSATPSSSLSSTTSSLFGAASTPAQTFSTFGTGSGFSAASSTTSLFGLAPAIASASSQLAINDNFTASPPAPTTRQPAQAELMADEHDELASPSSLQSMELRDEPQPASFNVLPSGSTDQPSRAELIVPIDARGVAAVWGRGNRVLFYADSDSNHDRFQRRSAKDMALVDFQYTFGCTGSLLQAWSVIFNQVQSAVSSAVTISAMQWRSQLLKFSMRYRAELEACLYSAAPTLSSPVTVKELANDSVPLSAYHQHLLSMEQMGSIWHLFELAFLDPHDNVTAQLVDWFHRTEPAPVIEDAVADSDEWWTDVLRLTAQGRLDTVIAMLEPHLDPTNTQAKLNFLPSTAMIALDRLVRSIPALTCRHLTRSQFQSKMAEYSEAVQTLSTSTPALHSHPYLPSLLELLCGDESVLAQCADDWVELLVATLIHNQPHANKAALKSLVSHCQSLITAKDEADGRNDRDSSAVNTLREQILLFDVHRAVILADQLFDMPCFTAHLVDLLHHASLLPTLRQRAPAASRLSLSGSAKKNLQAALVPVCNGGGSDSSEGPMSVRDWYVWQYATSIQYNERLWTLIPHYLFTLAADSVDPLRSLCETLLNQRPQSSTEMHKLLAFARRHSVPPVITNAMTRAFAQELLLAGAIGPAVRWFNEAGVDGQHTSARLIEQLLTRAVRTVGALNTKSAMVVEESNAPLIALVSAFKRETEALLESLIVDDINGVLASYDVNSGTLAQQSPSVWLLQQWRVYIEIRREIRDAQGAHGKSAPHSSLFQSQAKAAPTSVKDEDEDAQWTLTREAIAHLAVLLLDDQLPPVPWRLTLPVISHLAAMIGDLQLQSSDSDDDEAAIITASACQKLLLLVADVESSLLSSSRLNVSSRLVGAIRSVLTSEFTRAVKGEMDE